jgi:hypothetical protein
MPASKPDTVEAVAIGRRIEELLLDFLELITGKAA